MTRASLIPVFLFVIQLVGAIYKEDHNVRVEGEIGARVAVRLEDFWASFDYIKLRSCEVTHVESGTKYMIFPENSQSGLNYIGSGKSCSFEFSKMNSSHNGKWEIERKIGFIQDGEWVIFEPSDYNIIRVFSVRKLNAPLISTVEEGNYVSLYSNEMSAKNSTCILEQNKMKRDLRLLEKDVRGVENDKKCGGRMLVDNDSAGTWTINEFEGYEKRETAFEIKTINKINRTSIQRHLIWFKGDSQILQLESFGNIVHCELELPEGIKILLESPCLFDTVKVNALHEGIWIVRYRLENVMEFVEEFYEIEVRDPENVEVIVERRKDNSIDMICKPEMEYLTSCVFEKPNGASIFVQVAVGNYQYQYYGSGFNEGLPKGQRPECGLTIRKPSKDDYGLWKCSMANSRHQSKALVNIERNVGDKRPPIPHPVQHTYVRKGNDFEVKCGIGAKLDYCWLRSPKGSVYTVTKRAISKNSLEYTGKGFSLGDCSALLNMANEEMHSGNWMCYMGVHGGEEVMTIVPVTVTEDYLISYYNFDPVKNITEIECSQFPNATTKIQYCRWTRPGGYGIDKQRSEKFSTATSDNKCTLQLKYLEEQDRGEWTCHALLIGYEEEIYSSFIIGE